MRGKQRCSYCGVVSYGTNLFRTRFLFITIITFFIVIFLYNEKSIFSQYITQQQAYENANSIRLSIEKTKQAPSRDQQHGSYGLTGPQLPPQPFFDNSCSATFINEKISKRERELTQMLYLSLFFLGLFILITMWEFSHNRCPACKKSLPLMNKIKNRRQHHKSSGPVKKFLFPPKQNEET